jgi:GntR family transcriptional regulator, transcriptional repressor for pyruvate dehydrogenase complex
MAALQPIANMVVYRFRERPMIVNQHDRIWGALRDPNADEAVAALKEQMMYLQQKYAEAQAWRDARITPVKDSA